MGKLDGRRALVTGGASGIGLATVRRFIDEGAGVAIVDVNEAAGKQASNDTGAEFVAANASDAGEVADAFRRAGDVLGGLDIAYMNAGVTIRPPGRSEIGEIFDIAELTEDAYRRIMSINLDGVVYGVREAVKLMDGAGGSILCTASIAGITSYAPDPIYALTKHGVVGLVRALGPTLAERGITINAICPGITATPLVGDQAIKMLEDANFPVIPPEGIAEACVVAITSGKTGQAWPVQAGRPSEPYEFHGVPGPRVEGAIGRVPPGTPNISD
jgi:NAD(P)-dependent dehydrogenase (short-subunit alcohol dehydrogenase family)